MTARRGRLNEPEGAQCGLLAAQIAFSSGRGSDAPSLLLAAATRLETLDAGLSRAAYLEATWAAWTAMHLANPIGVVEVSEAVRKAPPATGDPTPEDLMLDGLAARVVDGYPAGAPTLQRALRRVQRPRDGRAPRRADMGVARGRAHGRRRVVRARYPADASRPSGRRTYGASARAAHDRGLARARRRLLAGRDSARRSRLDHGRDGGCPDGPRAASPGGAARRRRPGANHGQHPRGDPARRGRPGPARRGRGGHALRGPRTLRRSS